MIAPLSSTMTRHPEGRGGAERLRHDERGAVFLPMTGIVVVLIGLSVVLAQQLGLSGRDADSMARAAARTGASSLSGSLTGLDPAEARSRAKGLDVRPACTAARASVAPDAQVTTCSVVGTTFVVVVVTTDAPTSTASATVSLTRGSTP